jgi:predicted metal-binding protein
MPQYELHIVVCTDPRRCAHQQDDAGRDGGELFTALTETVQDNELTARVQVSHCRCIFGCTYGPRIDVAPRNGGGKVLYGSVEGRAVISRRGAVDFHRIPNELSRLIRDNLPGE